MLSSHGIALSFSVLLNHFYICVTQTNDISRHMSPEQQILQELLYTRNYSDHKLYRPLSNQSEVLNVSLAVSLRQLIDLDETKNVSTI